MVDDPYVRKAMAGAYELATELVEGLTGKYHHAFAESLRTGDQKLSAQSFRDILGMGERDNPISAKDLQNKIKEWQIDPAKKEEMIRKIAQGISISGDQTLKDFQRELGSAQKAETAAVKALEARQAATTAAATTFATGPGIVAPPAGGMYKTPKEIENLFKPQPLEPEVVKGFQSLADGMSATNEVVRADHQELTELKKDVIKFKTTVPNSKLVADAVMQGVEAVSKPGHHGFLGLHSNDGFKAIDKNLWDAVNSTYQDDRKPDAKMVKEFQEILEKYHTTAKEGHEKVDRLTKQMTKAEGNEVKAEGKQVKAESKNNTAVDQYDEYANGGRGAAETNADGKLNTAKDAVTNAQTGKGGVDDLQRQLDAQKKQNQQKLTDAQADLKKYLEQHPNMVAVANKLMGDPVDLNAQHLAAPVFEGSAASAADATARAANPNANSVNGAPRPNIVGYGDDPKVAPTVGKPPAPGMPGGPSMAQEVNVTLQPGEILKVGPKTPVFGTFTVPATPSPGGGL